MAWKCHLYWTVNVLLLLLSMKVNPGNFVHVSKTWT